ncbi:MAG: ArnT family glycosyltransferase [Bryobacteraceae bacterium]
MPAERQTCRYAIAAAAIFAAVALLLARFQMGRLVLNIDEGILLDAAERMAHGQRLYVDFFAYLAPGSFWLQELAFRIFGVSLAAGRLIVCLDFSLQCAVVFWLVARLGYPRAAILTGVVFLGLEASNPVLLSPSHRWDSAALALLSVACGLEAFLGGRRTWWVLAGATIGAAAVCTPTMGLVAVFTAASLLASGRRADLGPYLAACAGVWAAAAVFMAAGGIALPFLHQLAWTAANYSRVNVTPYGRFNGGWQGFLDSTAGAAAPLRAFLLLVAALPAILPVATLLGWLLRWRRIAQPLRFSLAWMLAVMAAMVLTTWPRPDIGHLTIVAPLGYVLAALLLADRAPRWLGRAIAVVMLPWALVSLAESGRGIGADATLPSPVGNLRLDPGARPAIARLLSLVHPSQSLYVHPYLPLFYFLTQAANPTRYSYLGPGMMTAADEASALHDLKANPPAWVLDLPLDARTVRRVFPSAPAAGVHFASIENWIAANYQPLDPPLEIDGYRLLARRP